MAKNPRLFATVPQHVISDIGLTAQDWRVLLWVSFHDGRSLVRGKGAGCFVANNRLAERVQCEISSLSRSLSKLINLNYLLREKSGKNTTYRVIFPPNSSRFAAASVVAMSDGGLTGQDWRIYLAVSLHDGMSMRRGEGAGCYAANAQLADIANSKYGEVVTSLRKLVDRGYLKKDKYGNADRYRLSLLNTESCKTLVDGRQTPCNGKSRSGPTLCKETPQGIEIARFYEPQYIPLSVELNSVKTCKINSAKQLDVGADDLTDAGFFQREPLQNASAEGACQFERPLTEVPLASGSLLSRAPLPTIGAMLARYEHDLKKTPQQLDLTEWEAALYQVYEQSGDRQISNWALRLYDLTRRVHEDKQNTNTFK